LIVSFNVASAGPPNVALWYLAIASLLFLGPSLLVLSGVSTVANTETRLWWLLGSAAASIVLLAGWAVLNLGGAEVSRALFIEGSGVALAAGVILTLMVKRAWIGAVIGAVLAVPLLLRHVQIEPIDLSALTITAVAPIALCLSALICAVWLRLK
jgi:hypothetical protein